MQQLAEESLRVAPCALGSIVASAIDSGGVTRAVRLDLPRRFDLAVVVPDFDLPTLKARAALPSSYSREGAVFNVQRASLLIAALAAGSISAFPAALEDCFHQSYREALVPGLHEILKLRRAPFAAAIRQRAAAALPVCASATRAESEKPSHLTTFPFRTVNR
jgi:homoserine kinase